MVCCCGCCGSKSKCGCCCGGKRGATVAFGLLGLLLAAAVIAPPVYLYKTDQDYTKMFPIFKYGRLYLAKMAGGDPAALPDLTTKASADATVIKDDGSKATEGQEMHSRTYK